MAVQVPGAGAAVDDGLEGAEPALGRGAAAGQVDGEGLGLLAGERGSIPGEELAGAGGAGPGDPDVLEDVLQVRVGQVHVVLRHPVADLPEVTADVGQGRAMAQQAGGQRVPGLVGNVVAEVHGVDPGPEPAVEPLVGQRHGSVLAAVDRGEQREFCALLAGRAGSRSGR